LVNDSGRTGGIDGIDGSNSTTCIDGIAGNNSTNGISDVDGFDSLITEPSSLQRRVAVVRSQCRVSGELSPGHYTKKHMNCSSEQRASEL
jgi:hypothetical protein